MERKTTGSRSFGMFRGVFVPTFLSIVGVILFLRLGYIVGSAGIIGTLAIILLAVSITFSTGLSLSSITTNIRIGSGGAYSIISKTLGLEVGGSVGIPLFLAQTLSVVLYIFGFVEAWAFLFPSHPRVIILLASFLVVFLLTFISVRFAIRAQVFVFLIVIVALVSVFIGGDWTQRTVSETMSWNFPGGSVFWPLFALFFPAVTGLMAGVGMSGELKDPKRQIPRGILWALGITTLIYLGMSFWFGFSATKEQLISDNLLIVKLAFSNRIVLYGILAATFSSALTTFVAAPRLLQALGENSIVPLSSVFARKTKDGEPRIAILFTALFILMTFLFGSLDAIAPLLTIFFLMTYAIINLVVFIEQSLGLVSFRPIFKIPKIIPFYGAISSVVIMFYLNIFAGVFALLFLFLCYIYLVRKRLQPKEGDVRSGLFLGLSEWAAKIVTQLPESKKHIWKPNILYPAAFSNDLLRDYPIIKSITYPKGALSILGIMLKGKDARKFNLTKEKSKKELEVIESLAAKFKKEGIFTTYADVVIRSFVGGVCTSLQAMEGQFFHPNILFLPINELDFTKTAIERLFNTANNVGAGIVFFKRDEGLGLGAEEDIHLWLPKDAINKEFYQDKIYDLAMLVTYCLDRNWQGNINFWMCIDKKSQDKARAYLKKLLYESRFPAKTKINLSFESFARAIKKSPEGDIHIIPVQKSDDLIKFIDQLKKIKKTFLFVHDSTLEDVLA